MSSVEGSPGERSRSPIVAWRRWSGWGFPTSLDEVRVWRDFFVPFLVAATIWAYVDIAPRGRIDPVNLGRHKTDFTVYTEAGAAFFDGRDPYKVMNPRGWQYLYPPPFAILVAPLAALDSSAQVSAWFFLSFGFGFGCFFEGRKIWRLIQKPVDDDLPPKDLAKPVSRPTLFCLAGAAIVSATLPTLDCLQRGQLGIMLLYFLMLGARLTWKARSARGALLGGLVLALPAALKVVPILPAAYLIGQEWSRAVFGIRDRRTFSKAIGATAGLALGGFLYLFLIPSSLIGWQKNADSLRVWAARVASNDNLGKDSHFEFHALRNQSLTNAVYLLLAPEELAETASFTGPSTPEARARRQAVEARARRVDLAIRGAILVLLAVLLIQSGRGGLIDRAAGFGLAMSATLLISPLSWGHYYMVLAPAIFFPAVRLARNGRVRSAWVLAIAPTILIWTHYLFLHRVAPFGALGLGTTAWFALLAFATLQPQRQPRTESAAETAPIVAEPRKPFFRIRTKEFINFKN